MPPKAADEAARSLSTAKLRHKKAGARAALNYRADALLLLCGFWHNSQPHDEQWMPVERLSRNLV